VPAGQLSGILTEIAGGVLACIGSAHLLPEAQVDCPGETNARATALVFVAALVAMTLALSTILGDLSWGLKWPESAWTTVTHPSPGVSWYG
jgi:hypothetical protein